MSSKNMSNKVVGVIGAGGFGTAIANLLAHNTDVHLCVRNPQIVEQINQTRTAAGQKLAPSIVPTTSLEEITQQCTIIFPIIPSHGFKKLLQQLAPLLGPHHMLIHGVKGLDVSWPDTADPSTNNTSPLTRQQVHTMSELILAETNVTQVGCIAGPNLASELAQGLLAAVVISSNSPIVMETGQKLLRSNHFQVYTNPDMLGVELCGVLKNIMAIGAGCLDGLGQGENAKAFLISRGLVEMVHIGRAMGASVQPFLGLAGIGDLVATCASKLSRNYTVGYRLAQGESLAQILSNKALTAEGVHTVKVIHSLAAHYNMHVPITEMIYKILFENVPVQEAINHFMNSSLHIDVDFI
jgi:glycerol-3-phosphate dehydrogenase (NAD(P)+)